MPFCFNQIICQIPYYCPIQGIFFVSNWLDYLKAWKWLMVAKQMYLSILMLPFSSCLRPAQNACIFWEAVVSYTCILCIPNEEQFSWLSLPGQQKREIDVVWKANTSEANLEERSWQKKNKGDWNQNIIGLFSASQPLFISHWKIN